MKNIVWLAIVLAMIAAGVYIWNMRMAERKAPRVVREELLVRTEEELSKVEDVEMKEYPVETMPLHAAAQANEVQKINELLANGADPNAVNEDGYLALHIAARKGAVDAVKVLIEKTADINAQGKDGDTPLYYAARSGVIDTVRMLLDHGADPSIVNERGETACSVAQDGVYTEIVELINAADS